MNEIQRLAKTAVDKVMEGQKSAVAQWAGSPLADFVRVEIDSRGTVGELLVVNLLEAGGREPVHNENKTDSAKHWDFMCDGLTYEVKTASLGRDGGTFQHESIFKTRQYDGLIFVDIAPDDIYISMWVKAEIKWRELHSRKDGAYYKWDTTLTSPATIERGGKRRKFCVRDAAARDIADFMSRFADFERRIRAKKRPARSL